MNNFFQIERAKVIKAYPFETGTSNNGPWANRVVLVEFEVPSVQDEKPSLCRAAVTFNGQMAVEARDNIREGNPYNNIPDMFLQLTVRPWGDVKEYNGEKGSFNIPKNTLNVVQYAILTL